MTVFLAELDGVLAINEKMKLSAFALACTCWGIDSLWIVDPGEASRDWHPHSSTLCVESFPSVLDAVAEHSGPIVFLEPRQPSTSLLDFEHPEGAMYVFGRDRGSGLRGSLVSMDREDVDIVYVPASRDCYGFQVATLVAWDRYTKRVLLTT